MKNKKSMISSMLFAAAIFTQAPSVVAQDLNQKPTIAVLNIDSKGLPVNSEAMGYIVRLELEKTGRYSVMDRYEVAEVTNKNSVHPSECYSKSCLVSTGRLLKVEKMLGGSVELLDQKVVISLRLIDVTTGVVEKSDATEYLNLPELQKMIRISVQKITGITPDEVMVNELIDYDVPIQSPKNTLRLNGPRMGFATTTGMNSAILQSKAAVGGFDMYPVSFEFGWQQEFQYISAGNFQALIENVFMVSGLESGRFIPNYAPLLGFRFGKQAWEFAFGPTFRFVRKAYGYYDSTGAWRLANEGVPASATTTSRLDSRGNVALSTGLVIAIGRTFHSGYLNIPLNAYIAPRKDGTTIGATFGFNIQKKDKAHKYRKTEENSNDDYRRK